MIIPNQNHSANSNTPSTKKINGFFLLHVLNQKVISINVSMKSMPKSGVQNYISNSLKYSLLQTNQFQQNIYTVYSKLCLLEGCNCQFPFEFSHSIRLLNKFLSLVYLQMTTSKALCELNLNQSKKRKINFILHRENVQ